MKPTIVDIQIIKWIKQSVIHNQNWHRYSKPYNDNDYLVIIKDQYDTAKSLGITEYSIVEKVHEPNFEAIVVNNKEDVNLLMLSSNVLYCEKIGTLIKSQKYTASL